jgi:hypothetical protein
MSGSLIAKPTKTLKNKVVLIPRFGKSIPKERVNMLVMMKVTIGVEKPIVTYFACERLIESVCFRKLLKHRISAIRGSIAVQTVDIK